ncbi:hypothetical protein HRG_004995 [Hirsutella rhossiliensis]|uniref:Uncharacterized protein n=1 Tax=Hirsutella rhossiliensis TaxID=111463 RepID=A0A9P8N0Y0_9HYPO|nr:uncharacterized protein HRG_04995 [Hirsutella rhossiliensis]KAH0964567.1 hypothetical protein HRG_04995 [Hirsutella rhossiliensis]
MDDCTSIPEDRPITHFSVVYTSTVTFFGNRSDYTPPYEPLATPNFCTPTSARAFAPAHGPSLEPLVHYTAAGIKPTARKGMAHAFRPSFTFITTDKNPSVAFPSDPPPRFTPTRGQLVEDHGNADHKPAAGDGGSGDGDIGSVMHMTAAGGGDHGSGDQKKPDDDDHPRIVNHGSGNHKPAGGAGDGVGVDVKPAGHGLPTPDAASVKQGRLPSFKITARGNQVTINDKTFSDLEPEKTSVVTANGALFTILPNAIVGAGATIQKPVPAGTVVSVATPTGDVVGGLPVTLKGSEAVVGDATLTMVEEGTATVVDGQQVSLKPGTLVVGMQTLSFEPVMPSREKEMLVKGGELLTAIGRSVVVIHSTTFTYGPAVAETTQVVNGDTITIGPSGVFVHGIFIGGPSANATETRFEVVGGATITRIAPSLAVINSATFTIGPGTHWTTTVIAGETLTIGPTGVVMSTVTLKYPFGLAVTSTVRPTGTYSSDVPVETAGKGDEGDGSDKGGDDSDNGSDDDSMGSLVSPEFHVGWVALSIAIGIVLWV